MNLACKYDPSHGYYVFNDGILQLLSSFGVYVPAVKRTIFNLKTVDEVNVLDKNGKPKTEPVKNADGTDRLDKAGNKVLKNVKTVKKLDYPVLSTVVYWNDDTVTRVKNSAHDPITTETKSLPDGSTVVVASEESKERAIVYAFAKRLLGGLSETGESSGVGLSRTLAEIVSKSCDQNYDAAKAEYDAKIRKETYAKLKTDQAEKKNAKKDKYTFDDIIQMIGPMLSKLNDNATAEKTKLILEDAVNGGSKKSKKNS